MQKGENSAKKRAPAKAKPTAPKKPHGATANKQSDATEDTVKRSTSPGQKVKFRGGTLLGPLPPVLVTCGDEAAANIITIGWTGILNTQPPKTYISVRPTRFSHHMIGDTGEFVINLTPAALVRAADWCGTMTGAKVDKFAKFDLHKVYVEEVKAPLLAECPVSLCCRVTDVVPLGSHDMFVADIVAVYADEALLDKEGKLHMERAGLCAYLHGEYFALGKKIGSFGFSVKKRR